MSNNKKLIFIDYLRSFSMLYIVYYWHLLSYTNAYPDYRNPVAKTITYVIVLGLFTFISGFLNGKSVIKSSTLFDFYIKRFLRIYPLYLIAVFLFFIYGLNDGITSLKSLFFVSMFYKAAPLTLWFITMIMLFYLITPILVKITKYPLKYLIFVILLMAFIIALLWIIPTIDIRLALYLPCFCLGIFCGFNGIDEEFYRIPYLIYFLILSLIIDLIPTGSVNVEILKQIPLMLSSSSLIFVASYKYKNVFPEISLISSLIYTSYAMYLFHRPVYESRKLLYFPDTIILQILYLLGIGFLLITLIDWELQWSNDKLFTKITQNSFILIFIKDV